MVNAAKINFGKYYLDENKSFIEKTWEGVSRYTWEYYQQTAGYSWSEIRNCWSDRVDYWGDATFVTNFSTKSQGITMGDFINIDNGEDSSIMNAYASFDDYMLSNEDVVKGYYIHEYGHTVQSKLWGSAYLFMPGLLSLWNCRDFWDKNKTSHDDFWTEVWANTYSKQYYKKYHPYYTFPSTLHVKYLNEKIDSIDLICKHCRLCML